MSQPVSRCDRYEEPGNRRPYANIAPDQQPGRVVDEPLGWFPAILLSILPAILVAVYVGTQQTEIVITGSATGRTVTVGPTTADIIAAGVGSLVGLIITLRAFFALLNIERSLRGR